MEDPNSHKQHLVKDLISTKTQDFLQSVGILSKYDMIEYVSFERLLILISQNAENTEEVVSLLKDDFNRQRQATKKPTNFHFPIINNGEILKFRIATFMEEYLRQCQSQQKHQTIQSKQETAVQSNQIFYKFDLRQDEPFKEFSVTNQQQQNSLKIEKHGYDNETIDFIVPSFFYKLGNGQYRLSTKRLLSFQVTSLFRRQLEEVSELIRKQILQSAYLLSSYSSTSFDKGGAKISPIRTLRSQLLWMQTRSSQSNCELQIGLFPNIMKNRKIFGKDYDLMKDLNRHNAFQVGRYPSDAEEEKLSINIGRHSYDNGLSMRRMVCGLHPEITFMNTGHEVSSDYDSSDSFMTILQQRRQAKYKFKWNCKF